MKEKKELLGMVAYGVCSQLLPIAIIPFLTRIYSPSDFGNLALYISASIILSTLMTLRYDSAIYKPSSEECAEKIVVVNFFIITIVTISSIVFYCFSDFVIDYSVVVFCFIVVSAVFQALNRVIQNYVMRKQDFKTFKVALVVRTSFIILFQVVLYKFDYGLILGNLLGVICCFCYLLSEKYNSFVNFKFKGFSFLYETAVNYKSFPLYSFPAVMLNTVVNNSIPLAIITLYDIRVAGLFALVHKLLGMPTALIGNILSQYLMSKVSLSLRDTTFNLHRFVLKFVLLLCFSSLILFGTIVLVPESFLVKLFGSEWEGITSIIFSIVMFYASRFIASPISVVNQVRGFNKTELIWQVSYALSILSVYSYAKHFSISVNDFLLTFSSVSAIMYIILAIVNIKNSNEKYR
ncbi:lipopolysaccharide biosynthesis protein [Photobacterium profundum]|uniref:lipopolysaccharide biosynthesis protein n=1 Tax=Photobacterium profundum TaxID=74109 RepID=UPI003D0B9E01